MKRFYIPVIAIALAALMVGCKKAEDSNAAPAATTTTTTGADTAPKADSTTTADNTAGDINGSWDVTSTAGPKGSAEFKPDGTCTATIELPGSKGGTISATMEGSYKVEGDKMTTTFTKLSATGTDESSKKEAADVEKNPLPKPSVDKIAWKGKDEFTATTSDNKGADGKPDVTTFKRKSG